MTLADLRWLYDAENMWRFRYFEKLAGDFGIEVASIQSPRQTPSQVIVDEALELVQKADAFLLSKSSFDQLDIPAMWASVHNRISNGAGAIVLAPPLPRREHAIDAFLAKYDITLSPVRIVNKKGAVKTGNERAVVFQRSPHRFRDSTIFAGVDQVTVLQPDAIWYGGESLPLLVAAEDDSCVDATTDLPSSWPPCELACFAIWSGTNGGLVLTMAGSVLHDPTTLQIDGYNSGCEINRQFAVNILRRVCGNRTSMFSPVSPYDLYKHIEVNMARTVVEFLQFHNPSKWWQELVPEKVRENCETRMKTEKRNLPPQAYFMFIELKAVLKNNWQIFATTFSRAGKSGGANKCLEFMDRVNEIRKLVAHPVKEDYSPTKLGQVELQFLTEVSEFVLRLYNCHKEMLCGSFLASSPFAPSSHPR